MLEAWALEIVAAFAAIQLLALAYFYYRVGNDSDDRDPGALASEAVDVDDAADADDVEATDGHESVACSECGTANDPEYRYCRDCVTDLSGESIPGYRIHSPSERSL